MNRLIRCLVFVGVLASSSAARAATEAAVDALRGRTLDGTWVGTFESDGEGPAFVAVRVDGGQTPVRISVSIRSQRVAGARATGIVLAGDRLTFDLRADRTAGGGEHGWHFELRRAGGRLEGQLERLAGANAGLATFPLRLQKALELRLDQFRPFVGDYQIAAGAGAAGTNPDGDVLFVGYGSNAAKPGGSHYAYATLGDRLRQIVPLAAETFLADDGAKLVFERDASTQVRRLRFTPAGQAPATSEKLEARPASPAAQLADRVDLWREVEVAFEGPGATLSGSLYIPTSKGPHPALVFVHGSGPQLRLDNWPMADRFARAGIACLSFDKRGTGNSTGDWQQAGFGVLADDVVAAVEYLRGRPEIRPDAIGLWGVSQAGWVIPIAANKSAHIAFCIPVSGGAVSPAEQELWRRTQYLQFFGCDQRLLEAMRRGVALHLQWEQLYKAGKFPIPPLFETEPLDMDLDATAIIRRVRQPVLAIFGESDVLTPPRESAAIWANELHAGGNRDYSVRIFRHATHGLVVSDRPLEVLPESRLAPGYVKTMIDWIAQHTGGDKAQGATDSNRAQAAANFALDIAAGTPDIVESRGMQQLPWYGSAPVQVTLLLAGTLGTVWTMTIWPAAWAIRKFRRMPRRGAPKRNTVVMGWAVNFGALLMSEALLAIMRFLGDASPSAYYRSTEIDLWILAGLTLAIGYSAVVLVRSCIKGIGSRGRTRLEGASAWVFASTACVWTVFFVYWTWGPLLS